MMKSLWSGVSGLQAHQVAMDIEGNNIANVNTPGFKYSRANFSNLLSQTIKIATAPQGSLGGTNEAQIGVGSKVASTTQIFKQGSSKATDKLTDVSIEGDGFFMVSSDNGSTYKYTRNGDFLFDAKGNFVDQSGNKVQGWTKDLNPNTSSADISSTKVDTTQPVSNIKVTNGLRIPAHATNDVQLKANLNSGSTVINKKTMYDSEGRSGYLYNRTIKNIALTKAPTSGFSEREVYVSGPKKGEITNHNDFGFEIGTDMSVAVNSEGDFFNLQSASFDPKSKDNIGKSGINGQGIVVSVTDNSVPQKTFFYELRYTEGDVVAGQPPISNINTADGTITQSVLRNEKLAENTYTFTNEKNPRTEKTKVVYFNTNQELKTFLTSILRDPGQDGKKDFDVDIKMIKGKFTVYNKNKGIGDSINFNLESIKDNYTTENKLFEESLAPMSGIIDPEQKRSSSGVFMPSHASSIDLYDSLGTRYSLRFEFEKVASNEWKWTATVPEPATLVGGVPPDANILRGGVVKFTENGALKSYSPPNIVFNSNKGSERDQIIKIDFGKINGFNGFTHLDKPSSTVGIRQDGFAGGSLVGTRIDDTGTIIGKFSNDRSFALAKVAMASFANNTGLSSTGGNLFSETSNSGKPTIGVASTGGKGSISSSRLESSNVDLTNSLTQLIVVQRGFQANSKTVTTSDQMLNTLLQMKQ